MLHTLLKILFPSPCVSCGYLSEALCDSCKRYLSFSPHVREIDGMRVCSGMYFQAGTVLERLIHPFKYKHQASIFRLFVPPMREALKLLMEPSEVILVPVPLHKKRLLERGYNQSELLAKWVAKHIGAELSPLLKRVKDTGSQAHLPSSHERDENMKAAFEVCNELPKHGQIVLVDDIVTTGSTLLACRAALKAAGAKNIHALTLADREKDPEENPWN